MTVFVVMAVLLTLVLYVGAVDHDSNDIGGDSVPERLRNYSPVMSPILVCVCTFVTMSEYTFCNLVYFLLNRRVHHMVTTFGMMAISVTSNVTIEYFFIQSFGRNITLYWSKVFGICMASYLRDAVSDLQKWQTSKED